MSDAKPSRSFSEIVRDQWHESRKRLSPPLSPAQREQRDEQQRRDEADEQPRDH
jgi:hypothetical protein